MLRLGELRVIDDGASRKPVFAGGEGTSDIPLGGDISANTSSTMDGVVDAGAGTSEVALMVSYRGAFAL